MHALCRTPQIHEYPNKYKFKTLERGSPADPFSVATRKLLLHDVVHQSRCNKPDHSKLLNLSIAYTSKTYVWGFC